MPVVPEYGQPRVELQPGLNFRDNTRASGDMFGAGIGRALGAVGQGLADVGQAMQTVEIMDAQTQAKDARTKVLEKIQARQYGVDGSGGYLGLQGRAAVDAHKDYESGIDKDIAQGAAGLSPLAQRYYNEQIQPARLSAIQTGLAHSFDERKSWYVQSTASELDQYSNIYIDPNQSETERARAGAEITRIIDDGEKTGQLSPQQAEAFRAKFVDGSNLTYAKLYVDSNKELYAPTGDPVEDATAKIIRAESDGNPNASNPNSSASGVGQFLDSTWLTTVRANRPDLAGKSDSELLAMKSDPALGREMTRAYMQENAQKLRANNLPVTEGNLYLSHFAGPEGAKDILTADPNASVESILGSKVVEANPFLRGKNAAWMQTWANAKMNRISTGPLPPNFAALKPDQKQAVLDDIETVTNDQKVYVRSILESSVDNAPVAIQNTGSYSGPLPTQQQFVTAYGADGQQKFDAFQAAIETSKNIYAMRSMPNGQITDMVRAAVPTSSGNDADLENKQYTALSQAAASIIEQRKSDPVGYVQKVFPSVAAAWQGVSSGGVSFQQAIAQTVAAQRNLGIAPQDIQPLPKEIFAKAVSTFKSDALSEQDRAGAILAVMGMTKDPDQLASIYRGLVKEGLPEYVGGAIRAAMRGDQAAANRLMSAALVDPGKIPGELANKESEIKEEIQSSLMSEGSVGDVFYGLSSGNVDGLQRAADDSALLTRAVQMRLRQGESLSAAVEGAGKDLYGDVQRVTGDSRVQANILLPAGADPKPVLDGLAASKPDVYNALKSAATKLTGTGLKDNFTVSGDFKVAEPGNIDLTKRPRAQNPDGSISTVRSLSFEEDGKEVLIPTVSPDGKILSNEDAIKLYRETGQHLGKFDSVDQANAYAEALHNQQDKMYAAPASGANAIVNEALRNRIEDIMTNGYFVQAGNGYAFFDPYLGQPVSDENGKPLIFDEKTVTDRAKAAPSPGTGEIGTGLDPVARKMMGLDLMPQDAWKPMEQPQ